MGFGSGKRWRGIELMRAIFATDLKGTILELFNTVMKIIH